MQKQDDRLDFWDTVGSVLWFFMDASWMLELDTLAMVMIIPTSLVNLYSFRYTRRTLPAFAITGAMNSWLAMNICWMIQDLRGIPALLSVSKLLFMLGALLIVMSALASRNALEFVGVLRRFSRFRIKP